MTRRFRKQKRLQIACWPQPTEGTIGRGGSRPKLSMRSGEPGFLGSRCRRQGGFRYATLLSRSAQEITGSRGSHHRSDDRM